MKLSELLEDQQMDKGDWIISKFESGELTFDQAKKELETNGLEVYIHELNMADELIKGKRKMH